MSLDPGKRPLHVLTLTPFYPTAEDDANGCFVAEPLAVLAQLGVRNSILTAQPFYRGKLSGNDAAPKAEYRKYFSLPGGFGLASAGAFLFASIVGRVRHLNRERKIDVIHAHGPLPCGHAAMLLGRELGIPFVVTVHGLDAYATRQVQGRAGEWCRRISAHVFRSTRSVVCISEHVRDQVLAGARASTSLVFNGVDAERFSPPSKLSPAQDSSPEACVVSIGNLIPTKGHDILIRAFAAATAGSPAVRLKIVGEGPEKPHLEVLTRDLKIDTRVHFLGRISRREVARLLQQSILFALPSSYEGLGCVYLEAMSSGKVAIGCRGQGIEEIIQHQYNGWLIDPGSTEQLATALSTLLADVGLRATIGEHARQTILAGLTLQHQAERLLRVYEECLA